MTIANNTDVYRIVVPSFGLNFESFSDEAKSTPFTFTPYIGKELNEHWTLELSQFLDLSKIKDDQYGNFTPLQKYVRKDQRFGFGLFGRYQVNPGNKLVGFLQPQFIYDPGIATVELDGVDTGEATIDIFSADILGELYILFQTI